MAKRFTDTEKWKRPWFADLPNLAKLAWIYVVDDCDHRGVWVANFKRLSFDLGSKISRERFEGWFGAKVIPIDADKYFIPSFVDFQYGERKDLNPGNKAHRAIITLLDRHSDQIEGALKGLASPSIRGQGEGEGYGEGEGEGEGDSGAAAGATAFDFEAIWRLYPRRVDKTDARDRFHRLIKTPQDFADLRRAVVNYAADVRANQTAEKYVKHFATFLGTEDKQRWRDWVRVERPGAPPVPADQAEQRRAARALTAAREILAAFKDQSVDPPVLGELAERVVDRLGGWDTLRRTELAASSVLERQWKELGMVILAADESLGVST